MDRNVISFGLIGSERYRGTKIRKWSKETDGPAIVRHASLDAARDVIPWGSGKRCPWYQGGYQGTAEALVASKKR